MLGQAAIYVFDSAAGGAPLPSPLAIWDAGSVIETAGLISQVTDLSGNDNHLVQSDDLLKPTLTASNPDYQDGPSIDATISLLSSVDTVPAQSNSLLFVCNLVNIAGSYLYYGLVDANYVYFFNTGTIEVTSQSDSGATSLTGGAYTSAEPMVLGITMGATADECKLFVNGVSVGAFDGPLGADPLNVVLNVFADNTGAAPCTATVRRIELYPQLSPAQMVARSTQLAATYL